MESEAEIVFTRFKDPIDSGFLSRFPALQFLVSPTTGISHINLAECAKRNVEVVSLRNCKEHLHDIRSTSEFTILLILSVLRRFHQACRDLHETSIQFRMSYRGSDLSGRSVGIVGFGRIGRHVYEYLLAFGANPIVWDLDDLRLSALPEEHKANSLESLLASSEILTLHVDLNHTSHGLINKKCLSLLPHGAALINTSRAEVIVKNDLLQSIQSGQLSAYAADVMWDESAPTLDHDLLQLEAQGFNVLLTPHIGGCTLSSMEATELLVAKYLVQRLSSKTTL